MKFAIFGNTYQAKKSFHAVTLFQLLKRQGAEICMCREFYQFLTTNLKMEIEADYLFDGDDFTWKCLSTPCSKATTSQPIW